MISSEIPDNPDEFQDWLYNRLLELNKRLSLKNIAYLGRRCYELGLVSKNNIWLSRNN